MREDGPWWGIVMGAAHGNLLFGCGRPVHRDGILLSMIRAKTKAASGGGFGVLLRVHEPRPPGCNTSGTKIAR